MSKLTIQKVSSTEDRSLPAFAEFDELINRMQKRAYELFANRGFLQGHDFEDWLTAEREFGWPTAELEEEDDEFELKVALPGFKPEDITVTATPREIIVKAAQEEKRKKPAEAGKSKIQWSEFRSNDVYRRVELPSEIDVDHVEAELEHGILEIEAPKAVVKKATPKRRVKVSTAA